MTTGNQTRRLLQSAAFSVALLLVTAPAALADPGGLPTRDLGHTPVASMNTDVPSLAQNAPKPDGDFLSCHSAWHAPGGPSWTRRGSEALDDRAPGR
jgi:hypothetical protein